MTQTSLSWRARAQFLAQGVACGVAIATAGFALVACDHPSAQEPTPAAAASPPVIAAQAVVEKSVLVDHLLVTWYGNPRTGRMGVLGRYRGADLASGLRKQAQAYAGLTTKKVLPAYHLVAVIAQPSTSRDDQVRS